MIEISKAKKSIGYTEVFRELSQQEINKTKENGFKIYLYPYKVFNLHDMKYIEKKMYYITWNENHYFCRLKPRLELEEL